MRFTSENPHGQNNSNSIQHSRRRSSSTREGGGVKTKLAQQVIPETPRLSHGVHAHVHAWTVLADARGARPAQRYRASGLDVGVDLEQFASLVAAIVGSVVIIFSISDDEAHLLCLGVVGHAPRLVGAAPREPRPRPVPRPPANQELVVPLFAGIVRGLAAWCSRRREWHVFPYPHERGGHGHHAIQEQLVRRIGLINLFSGGQEGERGPLVPENRWSTIPLFPLDDRSSFVT